MTTFVIVHGAGGSAWEWHLVREELLARGHDVVAVDLPSEDESAGLEQYADTVVAAVRAATGGRSRRAAEDVVLVAHSLGGFVAPLVAARIPVRRLVLVAAMVPAPGETGDGWWESSGYLAAVRERGAPRDDGAGHDDEADRDDAGREDGAVADEGPGAAEIATFMHDLDPALAAEALRRGRDQAGRIMSEPWPLTAWPDVPTSYLVLRDDRFFPASFLHRLARERLGVEADEMPGSHAAYLSRPAELAERLVAYSELPSRR
ncbi:alpha/beta hydrolase [Georgenia sp. EYE_87]|uniref:alpha/beta fold hydrolase n=1 Tax=Georgenia sp. EYE_87 TaxID=2853448 RepID=UPI0020054276|nr:alpha/beta fold hydrolase [Georgenia sp. EYE_87]MCK6211547.1 alpha/beta hydrolase [Georgenia sp. EYE_87]